MSLKSIAEMCGVSVSTVSRVLNKAPGPCASPEVRERVWRAAQETGYAPNRTAQALRRGEPERPALRIAIVTARTLLLETDPFFYDLYMSIQSELCRCGCAFFRRDISGGTGEELEPCDGMVILGRCAPEMIDRLREISPNIVGVWRNPTEYAVDEVVCDGKKAAANAVEYLISRGFRRIAYIGDCSYESRYVGYCETLIRSNLPINYPLVFPTGQTRSEGREAMERIIAHGEADAVFCANDITAAGALDALQAIRRHRPKIAVISIDNIELSRQTRPMLTTINIPRGDMAHMAVQVLTDRVAGGHSEKLRVEFPCRLIKRKSCFED